MAKQEKTTEAPAVQAAPTIAMQLQELEAKKRQIVEQLQKDMDAKYEAYIEAKAQLEVALGVQKRVRPSKESFENSKSTVLNSIIDGSTTLESIVSATGVDKQIVNSAIGALRRGNQIRTVGRGKYELIKPAQA